MVSTSKRCQFVNVVILFQLIHKVFIIEKGLNFERQKFRISDVSNLKINERSSVERPNLRITKTGDKNSEVRTSKLI